MFDFAPIYTAHLFPKLNTLLINLLKSLSPADWDRKTPAPKWNVKDIAAHLLDTNLRTISMLRDGYFSKPDVNVDAYHDLVGYLNTLNAVWVDACSRLSPQVLVELLDITGKQFAEIMSGLPEGETAVFGVAWAGQEHSPNWFHMAREFSEKWHHQQQIRAAVGCEAPLYERAFYYPFLQVSMYAIPYQYRHVSADEGDIIKITVSGKGGGDWYMQYTNGMWLFTGPNQKLPVCEIVMEEAWAWRILMNAAGREEALQHIRISGNENLGLPLIEVRAVMV